MARGDKEYFRTEVAFVDGPEFRRLTPEAYKLYTVLEARCIITRRTVLYGLDASWLAAASGLNYQRVTVGLRLLAGCLYGKDQQPLINYYSIGGLYTIKVEGIDRNNPKFQFSESPYDPHKKPNGALLTERNGTERNGADIYPQKTKTGKSQPDTGWEKYRETYQTPAGRSTWKKAREKWNALVAGGMDPDTILRAAVNYCLENKPQFRKAAERWLVVEVIEECLTMTHGRSGRGEQPPGQEVDYNALMQDGGAKEEASDGNV
jgi:hypothetical protein